MDDFLETLRQVDAFAAENTVNVFCPIAGVELNFKPLTVKQTKEMLKTQMDTDTDVVQSGINLANTYNNIVIDNCVEGAATATNLSILDKEVVLFSLRVANDPILKKEEEEIDLVPITNNIKQLLPDKNIVKFTKTLSFKSGDIKLQLGLPTITKDTAFNKSLLSKTKDRKINDIVVEIFIAEACKYISNISVAGTDIDFNSAGKINNYIETLQKLPSSVLNAVSTYITTVKNYRKQLFSTDKHEIELSADFFSSI